MTVGGWFRTMGVLGALQLAAVGPTDAFQDEVGRYYDSARSICRTGVTPEITSAYEQARQATDQARAAGRIEANNFAGVKTPPQTVARLLRGPSDDLTREFAWGYRQALPRLNAVWYDRRSWRSVFLSSSAEP